MVAMVMDADSADDNDDEDDDGNDDAAAAGDYVGTDDDSLCACVWLWLASLATGSCRRKPS